jgi:hypothetical protein
VGLFLFSEGPFLPDSLFALILLKTTVMTKLLEKAIQKLKELPEKEQDHFAAVVLNDLNWQETFDDSADKLDQLGKGVLKEIKAGKFKKIDC